MTARLYIPVAAALLLSACSTGACYDNSNSLPKAGFYSAQSGEAVSVTGLQVMGADAPNDSLLVKQSATITQAYLPFNPEKGQTRFIFTSGAFSDHVTFSYETMPYFASAECGAMWRFRITDVTHSSLFIDSVAVTDSLITNIDAEQIKIYIKPADVDDETSGDDEDNTL